MRPCHPARRLRHRAHIASAGDRPGAGAALVLTLAGGALLLGACRSSQPAPPAAKPTRPLLAVSAAGTKRLRLAWTGGEGADSFDLERVDGGGTATIAHGLPPSVTSRDLDAFLPDVAGTEFVVEACNDVGCVASEPAVATPDVVLRAIGYLKAKGPDVGDRFGSSVDVSLDGSVLAVGAYAEDGVGSGVDPVDVDGGAGTDSGAAYAFTRDESGEWTDPVYLKASAPGPTDGFGYSLALSGDGTVLAVAAPFEQGSGTGVNPPVDDGVLGEGAVYVFTKGAGGVWQAPDYLKPSEQVAFEEFGIDLDLSEDGSVLAVGARDASGGGAVYLFVRSEVVGWVGPVRVTPDHVRPNDAFGKAVALSGDGRVLAVGAPYEESSGSGVNPPDDDASVTSGAAYVFALDETTGPAQVAYVKSPTPGHLDLFGWSVALNADGSMLVVGAPREDGGGTGVDPMPDDDATDSGAAYVYERAPGEAWTLAGYLKPSNTGAMDLFGAAVAVTADGSRIAVGAGDESGSGSGVAPPPDDAAEKSGAAYLFARGADGVWIAGPYLKAPAPGADDRFGYDLAFGDRGRLLVVSALNEDGAGSGEEPDPADDSLDASGAVFLY